MQKRNLEVCLTPAVFRHFENPDAIVVIIDVLRASSAICTAFSNGARSIIPVAEVEEARRYKDNGYKVAAERDGFVLDFADFGNSPFNFTPERVRGETIVYSTTNCTRIIEMARSARSVVIGSFLNISSLSDWLIQQHHDVLLLCAAWKDKINIEDTICAGAYAERLLATDKFATICDSVHISTDIWSIAGSDPMGYLEKAAQRSRLRDKGLDDCIEYCMRHDITDTIPAYIDGRLRDIALNRKAAPGHS